MLIESVVLAKDITRNDDGSLNALGVEAIFFSEQFPFTTRRIEALCQAIMARDVKRSLRLSFRVISPSGRTIVETVESTEEIPASPGDTPVIYFGYVIGPVECDEPGEYEVQCYANGEYAKGTAFHVRRGIRPPTTVRHGPVANRARSPGN